MDSILTSIDIINASCKGEESPLDNILGAAPNRDHLKEGIIIYERFKRRLYYGSSEVYGDSVGEEILEF